jgi:hypothetical protein
MPRPFYPRAQSASSNYCIGRTLDLVINDNGEMKFLTPPGFKLRLFVQPIAFPYPRSLEACGAYSYPFV